MNTFKEEKARLHAEFERTSRLVNIDEYSSHTNFNEIRGEHELLLSSEHEIIVSYKASNFKVGFIWRKKRSYYNQ